MPAAAPALFISHTTQDPRDSTRAHELADELRRLGVQVWIAPESIPAGSEWEEQIVDGVMKQCSHFLALVTPAASRSEWVGREVDLARMRYAQSEAAFTILPVFVGEVAGSPMVEFLRRFQAVAWRDNLAEQVYLTARALDIAAAPEPLESTARAWQFLEREKRRSAASRGGPQETAPGGIRRARHRGPSRTRPANGRALLQSRRCAESE